jgi:hypothetical protein
MLKNNFQLITSPINAVEMVENDVILDKQITIQACQIINKSLYMYFDCLQLDFISNTVLSK